MSKLKDKINIIINSFPITIEIYDSKIIIKDENKNRMKISKDNKLSILLNTNGIFHSGKNNQD